MKKILQYPWTTLESWIDRTSMYLTIVYGLGGIFLYAFVLSLGQWLPVSPFSLVASLLVLMASAGLASVVCGKITGVAAHHQSSIITALILFFLVSPATTPAEYGVLAAVSILAVVTKYIIVFRKQHLLNAAALAVFLLAITGYGVATWWVATSLLVVPVVVAGIVVVTKVRAWPLVLSFLAVGFATFLFEEWRFGSDLSVTWSMYFLMYPTLFLAFFMLTEPFTLPPTRTLRMGYGALVGFLASTAVFVPFFSMTPELALLIGNLVVYPYTLRRKLVLSFISRRELGPLLYELTFTKPQGFTFQAGQYVEWMLPHAPTDARGIRRYFTILSAPTESVVRLACKVPAPGSSYKQALLALTAGDTIIASQLAGDFVLPPPSTEKVAWVAGGIGITPFVSQAQYLRDTNATRNIVLLYAANSVEELVYKEVLESAAELIPVLRSGALPGAESGYLTADIIRRRVPDYASRTWFISGPPGMVAATSNVLTTLGVSRRQIVRDFFPGLA